jgi:tetratricopeptide (TPR) repeat protein
MAQTLYYSGWLALERGAFDEARALVQESAMIRREIGDRQGLGWALGRLGAIALWQGDCTAARSLLDQALALSRELDDKVAVVWSLQMLCMMLLDTGKFEQAEALGAEGVLLCRELGDRRDLVSSLLTMGRARLAMGDAEGAGPHFHEALAVAHELGDQVMVSGALGAFGVFSIAESRPTEGLREVSAAQTLSESLGFVGPKGHQDWVDRAVSQAFQELGSIAAEAAWAEGRSGRLEQVIAEALGVA